MQRVQKGERHQPMQRGRGCSDRSHSRHINSITYAQYHQLLFHPL